MEATGMRQWAAKGIMRGRDIGRRISAWWTERPERQFPAPWWQVLEREFEELHDRLEYRRDSLLVESDVAIALALAEITGERAGANVAAMARIRARLKDANMEPHPTTLVDSLNRLLRQNRLLYDPCLLHSGAVERQMAASYRRGAEADAESIELNRMLLERAFTEAAVVRLETRRRAALYGAIHGLAKRDKPIVRSALCLSGGGIRSASFALGALQGLAARNMLPKFDYLSTVSGGGYIGSWLSCWIHRHPDGMDGVVTQLRQGGSSPERNAGLEPAPLRFLREYSRFLNPAAGLFSVDTWTWIGIYMRNLGLNWLAWLPLLLCIALVPRVYHAALYAEQIAADFVFTLMTVAAVLALTTIIVNRPSLRDPAGAGASGSSDARVQRMRSQASIVALGVVPLCIFVLGFGLLAWKVTHEDPTAGLSRGLDLVSCSYSLFLAYGESIVIASWLASLVVLRAASWRMVKELLAMIMGGLVTWTLLWTVFGYTTSDVHAVKVTAAGFEIGFAIVYGLAAFPLSLAYILCGMSVYVALVSRLAWIEDEDREWWSRFGAWLLIAIAAWSVVGVATVLGPALLVAAPAIIAPMGGIAGLIGVLLGKSALSPAKEGAAAKASNSIVRAIWAVVGGHVLVVAAAGFILVLLAVISWAAGWALEHLLAAVKSSGFLWEAAREALMSKRALAGVHELCGAGPAYADLSLARNAQLNLDITCQQTPALVLTALAAAALFTLAMSGLMNFNKFSLHAAYRLRIVRAFLGASRGADRNPNPFTGFDPLDDVRMHELRPGLVSASHVKNPYRLARILAGQENVPGAEKLGDLVIDAYHGASLAQRLDEFRASGFVPRALEQDMVQGLNSLLEKGDLRKSLGPDASVAASADTLLPARRVLANRLILDAVLEDALNAYPMPPPPPHKLFHVVNLTLNIVHGKRLAWQERKAAPFAVTPLHCGSYYVGYRGSRQYGGEEGITIGTAAAVSGAAVSPNMGYSSSPLITLLLALFNVRLGWWLGNPGAAGHATYGRSEPKFSLGPLISEALGLTDERHPYVYLSDGGHFENMGLYEMVLRRARVIFLFDAEADPEYRFEGLGNAIRKVRIDLGVEITFEKLPMAKGVLPTNGHFAVGRILYKSADGPEAEDGVLYYFKPVLNGKEPRDVLHYAASNQGFPQQSTIDQFFGEAQFESYRKLGQHAVYSSLADLPDGDAWWRHLPSEARTQATAAPAGARAEASSYRDRLWPSRGMRRTIRS